MKVVLLTGGMGTRLSEEAAVRPKPLVEIGGRPILWHIMQTYAAWGYKEYVVALGYKGQQIKEYFLNYYYLERDISIQLQTGTVTVTDDEGDATSDTLIVTVGPGADEHEFNDTLATATVLGSDREKVALLRTRVPYGPSP